MKFITKPYIYVAKTHSQDWSSCNLRFGYIGIVAWKVRDWYFDIPWFNER